MMGPWMMRRSTYGVDGKSGVAGQFTLEIGNVKEPVANANPIENAIRALEAAGYKVEGDAAVREAGDGVEIRFDGVAQLAETCRKRGMDPVAMVNGILANSLEQEAIKAATRLPGAKKCRINVHISQVRMGEAA